MNLLDLLVLFNKKSASYFETNHTSQLELTRSIINIMQSVKLRTSRNNLRSSAYTVLSIFKKGGKSLINKTNNKRPKYLPLGTPDKT